MKIVRLTSCSHAEWTGAGLPLDEVKTEETCWKILRINPLKSPIDYVAIPWANLMNAGRLSVAKAIPNCLRTAFTVCQHIHFRQIVPLLESRNVGVLFTPHATRESKIGCVEIRPLPHYPVNGCKPASNKDILYSFVGSVDTHWTRKRIAELPGGKIVLRKQWHFQSENKKENQIEYQDILARSTFSLCPRGTGPGTIRFWESLQAGAIPVLISDGLVLPTEINWADCILRVPETTIEIQQIPQNLSKLNSDQLIQMRMALDETWRKFDGSQFVSTIRNWSKNLKSI